MVYRSKVQRTDPFVNQSTIGAVNLNSPVAQVAQALATIEPNLQKVIVNKIKEIKRDETVEGFQKGQRAGSNYMAQSELLYPKETELDETTGQIANKLAALTKAGNEEESRMLRANNPWFKHAFYSGKSKSLAKGLSKEWVEDIKRVQMVDPQDNKLKSMAAFPFSSPQVQGYIAGKRNARVEQLDMPEYYVKKYFLPELENGINSFQEEHTKLRTDLKLDNFEKLNRIGLETIVSEYLLQDKGKGREYIKSELKIWTDELRKYYVGKDFTKEMGVHTDYLMDRAIAIASQKSAGEARFQDARDFIQDFASLFPSYSLGKKKVIGADGVEKTVVAANPRNSLKNSKNFLDKLNTTLKTIDTLESRHYDFQDKIQPKLDIEEAEKIILEDDGKMSEEKREANQDRINELIATDPKVAKWVKDNQYVLSENNKERQIYYQQKITFGEIRDKKYGMTIINDIWNKSLKTPADLEFRENMINALKDDVKNANQVAIKAAGDTVSQLNKIYQNKKDITPNMQDQIEDIQFSIPNRYLQYWKTPSIDTGQVDENGKPILRTPNDDEFKDFVNQVQEQSINKIRAIRDVSAGEGNQTFNQNRTIDQFNQDILEDNRVRARSLIFTAQTLKVEAPFIDGVQERPTLEDVAEQFSYGEPISADGIIASFNDAEGNFDTTQKDSIRQFFRFVRVTDNQIKQYGLVEKGALSNERLTEYRKNTNVDRGGVIIEGQSGQVDDGTVGEGSENVDNLQVSDETQDEKSSNTGEKKEGIKNINDMEGVIDPKEIRKSGLDQNNLGNIANNFINAITGTQSAQAGEFQKPVMNPEVLKLIEDEDKVLSAKDIGIKDEKEEPNGARRQEHNFVIFYNLAKKYGHKFPELTAAQAMHETSNGASPSGKNNYLGFEANRVQIERGESSLLDTEQDFGKGLEKTKEDFVDFKDIRDQFIQYKKEWNDPFSDRKGIVSVDTPEEALDLILSRPDDMYATDKDYKQKVLNILKDAKRNPALF
jgi:hypothetical protein